jgi:hypothetical protein
MRAYLVVNVVISGESKKQTGIEAFLDVERMLQKSQTKTATPRPSSNRNPASREIKDNIQAEPIYIGESC